MDLICQTKRHIVPVAHWLRLLVDYDLLSFFDLSLLVVLEELGAKVDIAPALGIFLWVEGSSLRFGFFFLFLLFWLSGCLVCALSLLSV